MNVIIFADINNSYGFGRDAGPYRLATELRNNGYTVQIIDFFASLTLEDITKIVNKFVTNETLMVGFSTSHFSNTSQVMTRDFQQSVITRSKLYGECDCFPHSDEWIKDMQTIFLDANPNIKFVVGGEKTATATIDRYNMDYWVYGNAEVSLIELLKNINSFPKYVYSNRDYPFKNFSTCKIDWVENDLIFPNEHLPIEISRECQFNCPFCSYRNNAKIKNTKDIDTVRDELLYNYETFGVTGYMIMDPIFNDSIEKVESYCELFKSMPFDLEWSGFARLDIFNKYPEMRDMILESGAKAIQFGIETLNTPTMKIINKGISQEKTKELLYFINEKWDKKVITGSYFIIGLPEETEETFRKNMEWLCREETPLHAVDICVLSIRHLKNELSEEISYSEFSKDFEKYNYSGAKNWLNRTTGMTKEKALEILYDIAPLNLTKKYINFHHYSRMRSLGFTFDELWNMKKDYRDSLVESDKRLNRMKQEYLEGLFDI